MAVRLLETGVAGSVDSPRVLIVEDRLLLAQSLQSVLVSGGMVTEIVTKPSVTLVLATVAAIQPTVAIVAIGLGTASETESIVGALCEAGVPVLLMTGGNDRLRIASCIEEGAVGILDKSMDIATVIQIVSDAGGSNFGLPRPERYRLQDELRAHRERLRQARRPLERLTPRERKVLHDLTLGFRAAEIAERSSVSICTVRSQIKSILAKLGATSQVEVIAMAARSHWFPQTVD